MTNRKSRPWRLGLDLGTNSLGWCVFDLKKDDDGRQHPAGIRRMGVRIFTDGRDPQSGASLAQARRGPRGARRRRDRYLDRRADLLKALIRHGLMPADPAARKKLEGKCFDPWRLRAEGLDQALTLHELGRVIFHLNQRRGFKSNRKADRSRDDKEAKDAQDMKAAARKLDAVIGPDKKDARTLGEYLYKSRRAVLEKEEWKPLTPAKAETVRARPATVKGRNTYDFYPLRSMIADEFNALWAAQAAHHPELTDAVCDEIRDIVFYQRPLRPVDPGPCTLDPEEDLDKRDRRAPLALPIQQDFRILQELANLELFHKTNPTVRRRLTLAERDAVYTALKRSKDIPFERIRKKILKIDDIWGFNLESERRKGLKGDIVSFQLAREDAFGRRWFDGLSDVERHNIVLKLLDEEDSDEIVRIGVESWGLTLDEAEAVATVSLPVGYGRLGSKALSRVVPLLKERADRDGGPIRYADAVLAGGYDHHSDFRDGELLDELPYYGKTLQRYTAQVRSDSAPEWEREFGRLANPTVHIGLNQVRKLVNALIEKYGLPEEIVVELARDLKRTQEERKDFQTKQAENQRLNEKRKEKLAAAGIALRGDALLRMRLWEELNPGDAADRRCIYTGRQISMTMLFSPEVEIEHILPFTRSLDDSPANLTVSLRSANRVKGNQTPHEAFGHSPPGFEWVAIMLRVSALPKNKQWRFREDSLEMIRDRMKREAVRLEGSLPKEALDDIEKTGGFLARQLIDTAYLARVTRQYLWKICDPNNTWVIPGQMTALLRRKWGLNSLLSDHNQKNRTDHRHHAIDAFVVGLTDRSLLQRISTAAGRADGRLLDDMPDPWDGYRHDVETVLARTVVSHRPDHGIQGQLHKENPYRIVSYDTNTGMYVLSQRKSLTLLNDNEIERIRDPLLRDALLDALGNVSSNLKDLREAETALKEARRSRNKDRIEVAQQKVKALRHERKTAKKMAAKALPPILTEFSKERRIRRVRLLTTESSIVRIPAASSHPDKAFLSGENHCIDVYESKGGDWGFEGINLFQANDKDFVPEWRQIAPVPKLIMRVHKGDLLKLEDNGRESIFRVIKLAPTNRSFWVARHHEGGNLQQRHDDPDDPFRWLFLTFGQMKARRARRVTVNMIGQLHDPGPPT